MDTFCCCMVAAGYIYSSSFTIIMINQHNNGSTQRASATMVHCSHCCITPDTIATLVRSGVGVKQAVSAHIAGNTSVPGSATNVSHILLSIFLVLSSVRCTFPNAPISVRARCNYHSIAQLPDRQNIGPYIAITREDTCSSCRLCA